MIQTKLPSSSAPSTPALGQELAKQTPAAPQSDREPARRGVATPSSDSVAGAGDALAKSAKFNGAFGVNAGVTLGPQAPRVRTAALAVASPAVGAPAVASLAVAAPAVASLAVAAPAPALPAVATPAAPRPPAAASRPGFAATWAHGARSTAGVITDPYDAIPASLTTGSSLRRGALKVVWAIGLPFVYVLSWTVGIFAGLGAALSSRSKAGDGKAAATVAVAALGVGSTKPERWHEVGRQEFGLLTSLARGQGLDWDPDHGRFYFSSNSMLSGTDRGMSIAAHPFNGSVIPAEVRRLGGDHIGDIAYYQGKIYAPTEDSGTYEHPFVVVYDAATLEPLTVHAMPRELHKDGIPWVAVDGPRSKLYTAEWHGANRLNVFDLETAKPLGFVELATPVDRVQGGKVHNGALYLSGDQAPRSVLRVDLATGAVVPVAALGGDNVEVEGLAFTDDADGVTRLHVSVIEHKDGSFFEKLRKKRVTVRTFELDR